MSKTRQILGLLRAYESRNVTFVEPDGSWPIVWERAKGVHVWDVEGRKYLDLTAAFGVAAAGHANPRVVQAGQRQMAKLLHAMGDVHPHALKAKLARELSRITFERWARNKSGVRSPKSEVPETTGKTIFCNSGFEAVEAALKTALLATGKPGVIAFEGGYHGLGYGALNATHREHFRGPFRSQLGEFGHFVPFPKMGQASTLAVRQRIRGRQDRQDAGPTSKAVTSQVCGLLRRENIGAILVEPVQVRGGVNLPPPDFLPMLRQLCSEHGALLILDEIYTGFGRTGRWFACEHSGTGILPVSVEPFADRQDARPTTTSFGRGGVMPDLICLGKALTGGFPLSTCVGRADLMDAAWTPSSGEAIHTSTFLGHPVGCAMALAQIEEIRRHRLVERSAAVGEFLLAKLRALEIPDFGLRTFARGLGLLAGIELQRADGTPATHETLQAVKAMLHRGFIVLPEGEHANVISFTPPLTITEQQLERAVEALAAVLRSIQRA